MPTYADSANRGCDAPCVKNVWRRFSTSRRAGLGLNLLLIFGSPVLLHVAVGMNRFGNETAWYWGYGLVALLGLFLLASGMRQPRSINRR